MKTDMSSLAITMRLKQTSELRKLCIALGGDRLKKRLEKELKSEDFGKRSSTEKLNDF